MLRRVNTRPWGLEERRKKLGMVNTRFLGFSRNEEMVGEDHLFLRLGRVSIMSWQ